MVLVVKKPVANAGDIRDSGLILGSGRSPEEGMATHSIILALFLPQKSLVGYSPWGCKKSDMMSDGACTCSRTFSIGQGSLLHSVVTYIDIYG